MPDTTGYLYLLTFFDKGKAAGSIQIGAFPIINGRKYRAAQELSSDRLTTLVGISP